MHYTDGTTREFDLRTPDWHQAPAGVELAIETSYNNFKDGRPVRRPANVFLQRVALDAAKTVARVVLPRSDQGGKYFHRIFAADVR